MRRKFKLGWVFLPPRQISELVDQRNVASRTPIFFFRGEPEMLRRLVSASRYHHPNGTTPYHRSLSSVVVSALAPAPRTRQQVQQSLDTSVHAFIDMVQQLRHRPPRRNPTADDTRETKAPPSPPSPLDALQHASPAHVIAHVRSLSASEADEVVTYTVGRKRLQAALFVVEALGPGTQIFLLFFR